MTDIFISYSSKDREWVKPFATLLEEQSYRVWWDTGLLAGNDFQVTIPEKLAEARCVIVIWTENSVESLWVRAEASRALSRKVLVPVQLRDAEIPMPFDIIHAEDFRFWEGDKQSVIFKRLLLAVAQHTAPSLLLERAEQAWFDRELVVENAKITESERDAKALAKQQQAEFLRKQRGAAERQEKLKGTVMVLVNSGKGMAIVGLGLVAVVVGWQFSHSQETPIKAIKDVELPLVIEEKTVEEKKWEKLPSEPDMVKISGGTFTMGCVEERDDVAGGCDADEKPAHEVTVGDFWLARAEVTVGWFKAFVEATSYTTTAEEKGSCWGTGKGERGYIDGSNWRAPGFSQTNKHPVVCVSWLDAKAFIEWLNDQSQNNYRLPTEVEWEYAARGKSNKQIYYWGQKLDKACDFSNFADQAVSCHDGYIYTAPVNNFKENAYGLFDMSGNVWEWMEDVYSPYSARGGRVSSAISLGGLRVIRGGSWYNKPKLVRSADRNRASVKFRDSSIGFRVAQNKGKQ